MSPVRLLDEMPNSRILRIPANDAGRLPEKTLEHRSMKRRLRRLPSSGGSVDTSPALFTSRCCSNSRRPSAGGRRPPSGLRPSSSMRRWDMLPRNSGTPPVKLLAPRRRPRSLLSLASDGGIRPDKELSVRLRYLSFSGSGAWGGISPENQLDDRSTYLMMLGLASSDSAGKPPRKALLSRERKARWVGMAGMAPTNKLTNRCQRLEDFTRHSHRAGQPKRHEPNSMVRRHVADPHGRQQQVLLG
ncbi:hypothetical protein HU200_045766 [Digitaria exilis]|uniref:Uncharacterized protein n=1 Tax=Digitaria exilis TaxID=1010633 RepID=A0A835B0J7_9POAL|nr:hypothetical protein HU200_045766 [Digitaria exilis]